jgi:prolyl oligopeptidase
MIKIVKERRAWWPVTFPGVTEDGEVAENSFKMRFILHGEDEHAALVARAVMLPARAERLATAAFGDEATAEEIEAKRLTVRSGLFAGLVKEIAVDWKEVLAENDDTLKFEDEHIRQLCNVGGAFFVRTDAHAPRGRVVVVDVGSPSTVLEVVGQSDATLESAHLYGGQLVLRCLDDARSTLRRVGLDGSDVSAIALPGTGTVEALSGRPGDRRFFFTFTSFTRPAGVCVHDLDTGETAWHTEPGLQVDDTAFVTEQVFVTSTDGARVPMFLVRRSDLPRPSESSGVDLPTLLYGYGGFSIPLTPSFRVAWLVWLELGGQLAVANLRGGGEYGEEWHDAGRLANKQQVFDDAIACAAWLVEQGWTTPRRLALNGRSNGGLLAGACLVQRPDLFGAVVPEFGVLDLLRYHRFTIGWAWASEYGTADDPEQLRWLLRTSPLHNVWPRTAYPPTLVVTSDHDDRVVPAHSYKFTAALQAAQAGDAPVLLRVQSDAGHGAGTPTSVAIEERADVLAFLVRALGLEELLGERDVAATPTSGGQ